LSDGALIGAEALIRWAKPQDDGTTELVPPYLFIPPAEQSGLIVPIGEWVLQEACEFNLRCQAAGIADFRTAVNISGIQFYKSDLVQVVRDTLDDTSLRPDQLELEVTESTIMEDIETTVSTLERLKDLGIELAIDDFGTGYSSLQYLKRFPIHRLKVDRSFIMHVTQDPDDAVIAKTIISLGHNLGLKVLAEGVEEAEHVEFLREEGCDEAQGYHYAKPMPEEEFMDYIKDITIADELSGPKTIQSGNSA
jgi:EAL domain-containing protein (putative c-di-GMP-specific phosphodiesterase class I)